MADGINDVSLVEFVLKERNYLDVLINNDELLITFEKIGPIYSNLKVCQFLRGHLDLTILRNT